MINFDLSRVDGVKRDPFLALTVLKSYARNISTINSNQSIYNDVKANYQDISEKTINDYITIKKNYILLKKLMLGILILEVRHQLEFLLKKA